MNHPSGVPVELGLTRRGVAPAPPVRTGSRKLGDKARLVRFFVALAVKERVWPGLHVRPLVAELFLTENCNLRCTSCACWRSHTEGELTTAEWRSVLDQLRNLGIVKVNFTGGEPLLRPDAIELLAYAADRGFSSLHLNTNATLLDRRMRSLVLDAGVRSFNISVDGPDAASHEAIRGRRGSFARTTYNLRALLEERERLALKVRLNFTILSSNVATLPAMARMAQSLEVPLYLNLGSDSTFLFRHADVSPEVDVALPELRQALTELDSMLRRDRRNLPRPADLRYVADHFVERVQRTVPCAESQLKLMIHSTGGVGGCWGHDPVANIRSTPLGEIVDSQHYRDEHRRFYRKDCVGCGSNYSLNLRWRPGSYLEDLRWRIGATLTSNT